MQNLISAGSTRVRCSNLGIRADRSLLANFTWEHEPGGAAWLVGSNGSGKSSLLRVLAGWQTAASGSVAWTGVSAGRLHYFNPAMSAGGDLRVGDFTALIQAITPPTADANVAALLPDTVTARKRFGQLSTGEGKRILLWALLRAGGGPLLLDEPYEHLSRDAKTVLTELLRARAAHDIVIVATNQEVPECDLDTLLTFNGDHIEVRDAA